MTFRSLDYLRVFDADKGEGFSILFWSKFDFRGFVSREIRGLHSRGWLSTDSPIFTDVRTAAFGIGLPIWFKVRRSPGWLSTGTT
ncbi:MAG: hypothetical protein JWN25_389 [Verrucomicrobiales bacterium]|nr:hypothetical protein [Verrucomicrobiales bacterium]